ncbi:DUF1549 domain-containing protein [bacterium]|nr:DUF1549 domain-containing protein [bacterium]
MAWEFNHSLIGQRLQGVALLVVVAVSAARSDTLLADESSAEQLRFFEQKIRPVLVAKCYECHSAKAAAAGKLKGGLRLDSRASGLKGGDSGPAVVPRDVDASLLISAIEYDGWEMPPQGKLPDAVIADFRQWIKLGALDPRLDVTPLPEKPAKEDSTKVDHWAFHLVADVAPPEIADDDWSRNGIDRFVLAKLQQNGLTPSDPADRVTLLRRVTLDLIGLPPTPEDVDAFLADQSPDAYERVIDRLLASPHYGERWGRHWLDLARYADSSGFHNDLDRPTAWRYRDYVVRSFNEDKPYAQFVAEQLAGDEVDWASEETIVATGFCRNGPSNDDNMGNDKEKYRLDQLDDVISTTSSVFLGLTLGCARCHDHKYDPIPTDDYYRFLAIFNSTEKYGGVRHVKSGKKTAGGETAPLALIETSAEPRPTFVLRRGNHHTPGAEVGPGVPAAIAFNEVTFSSPGENAKSTGRRRTLAQWIADPDNVLTYRVLANRLWQHFFGRGIVETTSNFGVNGATPTHPELLDFLARQITSHIGQLKAVQRLIVTSATYCQSSKHHPQHDSVDPGNHLLWRQNVRRLEAEAIRDSVLAASGNLNRAMYGPGIKPRMRAELITASQRNKWPTIKVEQPEHWRRSVYIYVKRQLLMPMMELFDSPTTTDSCAVRPASILPTQALILMNDEFTEDQAEALARRAEAASNDDLDTAIRTAYRRTMCREPSGSRLSRSIGFVEQQMSSWKAAGTSNDEARHKSLSDFCHVLLNSSEFVFVD